MAEMADLLLVLLACLVALFICVLVKGRKKPSAPKAPESPTFRTLLLVTPSDESLTDAVKSVLIDTWGDLPVSELAGRSVVDLAFEFQATFPSPQYDDATRMKIAKAVHVVLVGDGGEEVRAEKTPTPEPSSASPRGRLEELAQRSKTVTGTNSTVRGGIYHVLEVSGLNVTVRDVIVLKQCSVHGTNASGRIYAAPGVQVDVTGMNADVQVVQLPWDELAERAAALRRTA